MSDKVDAWMPLWIGAYLADTMALSRDSHGGYLLLLFAYWRNGGPLLDDDEDLAGITKATPAEWKKLRPRLERFFTVENGQWSHGRADKELVKAGNYKAAAVSKAKAAAQARWEKHREQASSNAPSMLQALPEQCPTPSPREELSTPTVSHPPAVAVGTGKPSVPCPYDAIVAAYHDTLPSLPRVKLMGEPRKKALRKVWGWVLSSRKSDGERRATTADEAIDWLRGYFEHASKNDFLMGRTSRAAEHAGWQCDLDFLLTDKGMKQVIEKTVEQAA